MLQCINNNGNDSWDWFAYTSISFSSLMFFGVLAHFFYKHQRNLLFGLAGAFLNEIKEETIDEWCVKLTLVLPAAVCWTLTALWPERSASCLHAPSSWP